MKAFWVAISKIINKVNYKKYADLVPDIIKKYNCKILARSGNFKVLEVTDKFHRFLIKEFSSLEDGQKCWSVKEYRKASSFRKNETGLVDSRNTTK